MFILRDLLLPLQEEFSNTELGQKRKSGLHMLCFQLLFHLLRQLRRTCCVLCKHCLD